jgi:hypothetical protein
MSPDPLDTKPVTSLVSLQRYATPQRHNLGREETRAFRTTIRKAGEIILQQTCPQMDHGKHLIE